MTDPSKRSVYGSQLVRPSSLPERPRASIDIERTAAWALDIETGRLELSHDARTLMGLPQAEGSTEFSRFLQHLPAQDRRRVREAFVALRAGAWGLDVELRVTRGRGAPAWIRIRGERIGTGRVLGIAHAIDDEVASRQRTQFQQEALLKLASDNPYGRTELTTLIAQIDETAAQVLGVGRSSVWLFSDDASAMHCLDMFDIATARHCDGFMLERNQAPAYFRAMDEERTIAVRDARHDPRMVELLSDYLEPRNTGALIEAAIRRNGVTVGVVCCEHLGSTREWKPDEQHFIASLADMVALGLEARERQRATEALAESEDRYRSLVRNLPGIVYRSDYKPPWTALYMSEGTEELTGYPASDFIDNRVRTFISLIEENDERRSTVDIESALADDQPYISEYRIEHRQKGLRWIRDYGRGIRDDRGELLFLDGVLLDITEEKIADQRIDAERDALLGLATDRTLIDGDLPAAMRAIAKKAATVLGCSQVSIWLWDHPGSETCCTETFELESGEHRAGMPFDIDDHPEYLEALKRSRTVAVRDARAHGSHPPSAGRQQLPRASLDAGIRRAGETIGVVRVEHTGAPRDWSADEHAFVASVADLVTQALGSAELREAKEALGRRNVTLQVINELTDRLYRTHNYEDLAREAVRILASHVEAPRSAFYVVDKPADTLRLTAARGYREETERKAARIPLDQSLGGTALNEGRVIVSSLREDIRPNARARSAVMAEGVQAVIAVPLMFQEEPLGVIYLSYSEPVAFDEQTLESLDSMGKSVGLALANLNQLEQLRRQANHDSLTGLPNRSQLHQVIDEVIPTDRPFALMLMDLDGFKEVNDSLGHHTGDLLLRGLGTRLQKALEPAGALVARLGGDEFAVLLQDVSDSAAAQGRAEEILALVTQPLEVDGVNLEVGASIGLALFPDHGRNGSALLRCADVAMYRAKEQGWGRAVYSRDLDIHSPERLTLMSELRGAIRNGQLELHFQPQIDMRARSVHGLEALVRWRHPKLGLILPERFVPLAEIGDVIRPFSLWVIEETLKCWRRWHEAGLDLHVSVNVSTRNLLDRTFPADVKALLDEHGVPGDNLEVEITESSLISDPHRAREVLETLSDYGVRFAVDDYGTGYSSLNYLSQLPIDTLKIDRSFVSNMRDNPHHRVIVRSTVELAHNLGLRVIAEGVEDEPTLFHLETLACDFVQGHLTGRPMPPDELDRWLESNPWTPPNPHV